MRTATKLTTVPRSLTGIIRAPNAATSNAQLVREYSSTAQQVSTAAHNLLVALLKHRRSTLRLAMRLEQARLGKAPALKTVHQQLPQSINFRVTDLLRTLLNHTVAFVGSTSADMARITQDRGTTKLVESVRQVKEIA